MIKKTYVVLGNNKKSDMLKRSLLITSLLLNMYMSLNLRGHSGESSRTGEADLGLKE